MTSGLTWDETYALGTPITQMLYAEPDMAGYAASQPLAHQPGSYQQYSSGSTNILCGVLTDLADTPDADLPRQELFAPLGLTSAIWEPDATGTPVCSSYLWATPRDWATIGEFALKDGVWAGERLLPEGWMKQTTTATPVATQRGEGLRRWLVGQPPGRRLARRRDPAGRTPTGPTGTTGSGSTSCRRPGWSWRGSASAPRSTPRTCTPRSSSPSWSPRAPK